MKFQYACTSILHIYLGCNLIELYTYLSQYKLIDVFCFALNWEFFSHNGDISPMYLLVVMSLYID